MREESPIESLNKALRKVREGMGKEIARTVELMEKARSGAAAPAARRPHRMRR